MGREYTTLSCGCMVSCNEGGGLLGRCSRNDCQFNIWCTRHQMCEICNECLSCGDHSGHSEKLDGLDYLKSLFGMR